jgi:hypothetical protein
MRLDTEAGKRRFTAEAAAIQQYNRGKEAPYRMKVAVQGSFVVAEVTVRPTKNAYRIRATLSDWYPARPPEIAVIEPAVLPPGTPHLLGGNRPCLFYHGGAYTAERWNPAKHTLVFAVLATWRWCLCLDLWVTTGRWPIPDAVR